MSTENIWVIGQSTTDALDDIETKILDFFATKLFLTHNTNVSVALKCQIANNNSWAR